MVWLSTSDMYRNVRSAARESGRSAKAPKSTSSNFTRTEPFLNASMSNATSVFVTCDALDCYGPGVPTSAGVRDLPQPPAPPCGARDRPAVYWVGAGEGH